LIDSNTADFYDRAKQRSGIEPAAICRYGMSQRSVTKGFINDTFIKKP